MAASLLSAQDLDRWPTGRWQARSMVISKFGVVAASQPLAARAGVQILESGGNAIDAAIAANATLGVVEPMGSGIGGDLFAIVYEAKTGKVTGLNASGWSPKGLTIERLRAKGFSSMPESGIESVTVPGVVAGWDELRKRFGRLSFKQTLAPAIYYAENGFPVSEIIAADWALSRNRLREQAETRRVYLANGEPPAVGQLFRNPDLARSLRHIAARGRDGFYRGPVADSILKLSERLGGSMDASDLVEYRPEWVTPITTSYRGWTISELPPNGQGIAVLEMLNILERFPMREYGHNTARSLHVLIEAKKLAYADLMRYIGDPRGTQLPVESLISKSFASQRAKLIRENEAACAALPSELTTFAGRPGGDTIYLSVADREGNMVSLIQSNYLDFGSALVAEATGFVLQNRGGLFTLEPGHPNAAGPRRRPLHTIIPGFLSNGSRRISFGIMGGWNQGQAHAQFVMNVVDHKMNVQQALEAARMTKRTFEGCDVSIESRVPESVRRELAGKGHQIELLGPYSKPVGGGQAIERNFESGVNLGGSDPRKDGAAMPEAPGWK
ncbi:MAG: gamma-glutamyltransferase [Acidobacteria bacterium]|nr:gamma-glutamyltransferase [Acidobacteriota bacterium]